MRVNGHRSLVTPVSRVGVSNATKTQLAREFNKRGERIATLERHVNVLGKMLIAITQEPESFQYRNGRVTIDRAAISRVEGGTRLSVEDEAEVAVLTVTLAKDQPVVSVPRLVTSAAHHG